MFDWEMSWLFKDPVVIINISCPDCLWNQLTTTWLNFDHSQSNSKNGLKTEKVKLPQRNNKIFLYFKPLSFCKIFKKFLAPAQSYEMCHFRTQDGPFVLNNFFWVQTIIITFIYKKSSTGSRVMRMHNFWTQNGSFAQMRFFSENLLMSLVSFIHTYLHAKN